MLENHTIVLHRKIRVTVVAQSFNPSTREAEQADFHVFQASQDYIVRPCLDK